MTVQINARVSDELGAELDRMASERGVERGALARDILAEAVGAWKEGRAMFERPNTPGPIDLQRIAVKLHEHTTELDRLLRRTDKRDAELARRVSEDTLGVSEARGAIVSDVSARFDASIELLRGELARTREELSMVAAKSPPALTDIEHKLERIESLATRERTHQVYNIGFGQWKWPVFAGLGAFFTIIGGAAFTALAAVLPDHWLAMRQVDRLLGSGDHAICRLVEHRFGTNLSGCRIDVEGRTVVVTATAQRSGRGRVR